MQVSVETTSGLERQVIITVPAERINQEVDKELKQQAKTRRLQGFRPGKVPISVIQKMFGKAIRHEILNQVIQETLPEAIDNENLMPAGTPSIEFKKNEAGEDFEYVATFEIYPEITLKNLEGVEVVREYADITEDDVTTMISTLQKQQASWVLVSEDVKAQEGDQVNIDFEGFIDDEAFSGGKGEDMDLVLGSNQMIPGFESGLIGCTTGQTLDLPVTFPENYQAENLKGQSAIFKVKVNAVSTQKLAELNADFYKNFGIQTEDEQEFRAEVKKNMMRELKQALKTKLKNRLFSKLNEVNVIEVPSALVDREIEALKKQALQRFGDQMAHMDLSSIPNDLFIEQAKSRVSTGLLLQEVIKSNNLQAADDKVRELISDVAETYEDAQEVIEHYTNNSDILNQFKGLALEDQVAELLMESATIVEKQVSYEEAIKPETKEKAGEDAVEAEENTVEAEH